MRLECVVNGKLGISEAQAPSLICASRATEGTFSFPCFPGRLRFSIGLELAILPKFVECLPATSYVIANDATLPAATSGKSSQLPCPTSLARRSLVA